MIAVLQGFAVIGVIIVLGMILGRTAVLGDDARGVLNRVAFYVGLPALLLVTLSNAAPAEVFSVPLLVSVVATFVVFGLYFGIATLLHKRSRAEAAIGAWSSSYVNAGNLGLPLSAYVLGSTTDVSALIVFQCVVLIPVGVAILDSSGRADTTVRARVLGLFANPTIAASVFGVAMSALGVRFPRPIADPLTLLAGLAVPTVLLAFGMSLSTRGERSARTGRADVATAVLFKVILMPVVAYALCRWAFHGSSAQVTTVTVLAALPSAQNVNAFAAVYRCGERLAREATLITTAASVPAIAVIVALLG
ncbi:AEC family transporter [Mycolicibacterium palauense]|uniref:AEC family transporter n=1 Tax=Mycolicibacterium palauense TaxID=2034511 RepID=UPI000BFECADF|nr:AEC family transporter [Mycolicibacterium palauense]